MPGSGRRPIFRVIQQKYRRWLRSAGLVRRLPPYAAAPIVADPPVDRSQERHELEAASAIASTEWGTIQSDAWKTAAVSVTGESHIREGAACQDAHFVTVTDQGMLLAAACDGAGSTLHGGRAAALVAAAFADQSPGIIWPDRLESGGDRRMLRLVRLELVKWVERLRDNLLTMIAAESGDPDQFLCTFVAVIAHPSVGGVFLHIGDGAAIAFDREEQCIKLSRPRNGSFLNETFFLIEENWRSHLRLSFFDKRATTLYLMSDGVSELVLQRVGRKLVPHAEFFRSVSTFLNTAEAEAAGPALVATLDSPSARAKVDDDKTLVWARVR